jgi:four helix bundle protein
LSTKDFLHRIKICRKEAKESRLWLRLLEIKNAVLEEERQRLVQESWELTLIFGSIVSDKEPQKQKYKNF